MDNVAALLNECRDLLEKIWTWDGEDEVRRQEVVRRIEAALSEKREAPAT